MKNVTIVFFFMIILSISCSLGIWKAYQLANSNILVKKETIFTVKNDTSRKSLGKQLYIKKVINQPIVLQWLLYLEPKLSHYKAGTYRLTPNMTVRDMLKLLESGKEVQFSLRFIEGMRLSDYLKQLREAPWIRHTLKDDKYITVANALKLDQEELIEGWFWPDTWMYTANTTDVAILNRAYKKMVAAVDKAWEKRLKGLPYQNKNQFVTIASIVEKETALSSERDRVASVFINRLRIGMRLQSDPTVIYGMGKKYVGKISRKDLKSPTAYNTYTINGLPPGPIAMPSQSSLNAVSHPAKTSYLYFVANGKGGHTFNTNLIDHNRSVQTYLKILKDKMYNNYA